jgi:hypothetical protein
MLELSLFYADLQQAAPPIKAEILRIAEAVSVADVE